MTYEQLILIENDDVAMKLAIAWEPYTKTLTKTDGGVIADGRWYRLWRGWAAHAGVTEAEAEQKGPMLIANDICYPDGRLDEIARQYIRREAATRAGIRQRLPERNEPHGKEEKTGKEQGRPPDKVPA